MILSDVIAIALSIIGFLLSMQGLWLLCRAMWPVKVEAASQRCEKNGLSCFFLGLPCTLILLLIATAASRRLGAPGQMLGFVILFFYVMFAGVGMAGLADHIGRRLPSPADAGRPWRSAVRGGAALELAWLIPVLGWFGLLPISLILGFGAATASLFSRAKRPQPKAPPTSTWREPTHDADAHAHAEGALT